MNKLELIQNSGLHDFELVSLTIDYTKATIILDVISPLTDYISHSFYISIHNFLHFSASHQEPWGGGKYIYTSDVQTTGTDTYRITLQLNSGDLILIDYKETQAETSVIVSPKK